MTRLNPPSYDEMTDAQRDLAAGAGYMELSDDGADQLVVIRPNYVHTVTWAGKPETVEQRLADGSTQLNPRASFALWQEERSGQSRPFDSKRAGRGGAAEEVHHDEVDPVL